MSQKVIPTAAAAVAAAAALEVAHFRSIPWCAAHLSASPNLVVEQAFSRTPKDQYEDALLSQTLNRKGAIPAFVTFYTKPAEARDLVREVKAFLSLGPMVNGWAGICHGGIAMTILDEVMGQLPAVNKLRGNLPDIPLMTAYLNTTFVRPVRTPTTIMVTARLLKVEGRKQFADAVIEDEKGEVLAKAEALFVMLKAKL
ncbi:HotDog domain-containing protein [Bombardia bombarda]|uniref:HotDog domain-containing protein n=1 Tax=Bombardia bombarda TaxID=252184 RepID=A0AA40C8K6_9PEZI|nr:HotDog domain-containing protein [Bombardia bombarda]